MTTRSIRSILLSASILAAAPALAADVTPERLANPDKEPQNWLMNHRSYDSQRFSPLARISKDNVKSLKLAYAVDIWGTVYKIDVRSGTTGRIVWRMDPKQERVPDRGLSNRGVALSGNFVIS